MALVNSYKDLLVWQKGILLVEKTYKFSNSFPKEEAYGLTSQIRRCSVSFPSNIAEGYGRNQTKDFIRFLQISSGSLYEFETQLEIAFRLDYTTHEVYIEALNLSTEIAKMLSSLIHKLKLSINS